LRNANFLVKGIKAIYNLMIDIQQQILLALPRLEIWDIYTQCLESGGFLTTTYRRSEDLCKSCGIPHAIREEK